MVGGTPSVAGAAARWGGRMTLDLPVCRQRLGEMQALVRRALIVPPARSAL